MKKYIVQGIIIMFEIGVVCGLITYLSDYFTNIESFNDGIQRFIAFMALYEFAIYLLSKNQFDAKKDSLLSYITLLKEVLLYINKPEKKYKDSILSKIKRLDKNDVFNDKKVIDSIKNIKINIDNDNIMNLSTELNYELINAEHIYNSYDLKWRNTLILKLFK